MKSTFSNVLFFLLTAFQVYSQGGDKPWQGRGQRQQTAETRKIIGSVVGEQGEPIPYASIVAYSKKDSSIIGGTASDIDGKFLLAIRPGIFTIKISYLSYTDHFIYDVKTVEGDVFLEPVKLTLNQNLLGEVLVEGERTVMELKLDMRVYNIGKDLSGMGSNAAELLDNIPSIEVDVEGNVSLRGSENVRILIDGKPSGLTGTRTQDALRQIQGDMIEKVEIITNPSARYDAEGEVGIINIVLKKQKQRGLNGVITINAGIPEMLGASINLNYNTGNVNFFANYSLNHRKSPGFGSSYQKFTQEDTSFSFTSNREHIRGGLSNMLRLGTDITINDNNSLTISGMVGLSNNLNESTLVYNDFNAAEQLVQVVNRDEKENEESNNYQVNLYHQKTFKTKGQSLVTQVQWSESEEIELADISENSNDLLINPLFQRTDNTEADKNFMLQSDFILPIGKSKKEGKFEAGIKANLRTLSSKYFAEELDDNSNWIALPNFSNHLNYIENIYAVYAMVGNKLGSVSYQLGLRAEYSDITTELTETNEVNQRDYLGLFPTAHFSYELKKSNFLQLSYARRLSRPRFWYLIPFYGLSDTRNFTTGNPNLNPEFTHSFDVGFLKQWTSASLLSSLYYRYSTSTIQRIVESDSLGYLHSYPINLGTESSFGLELSGSWQIVKALSLSGSLNFYRSKGDADYKEQNFDFDTYGWSVRSALKWNLSKKFSSQTSFHYRSPVESGQGRRLSSYNWDAGAALDILKGNGTLALSARDILNTRKRRSITNGVGFYQESEFQWHSRTVTLSFNYRLNQKKKREGRPMDNGFDEDEL